MEPGLSELIGGAVRLDPTAFEAIQSAPHGLRDALLVLLLAGASETLGQSVVLVLNRVSRRRFCLALVLGGVALALEALVWMGLVWLLVGALGVERPAFRSAARVIALAYAPLVLGFFVFLPYLGPMLMHVLRVWVLLAVVVGTSVVFGLPPLAAAVAASAGFIARWLLLGLFAQLGDRVGRIMRRGGSGASTGRLALGSVERRR